LITIVGSGLSSLVCAFELIRTGERVQHVISDRAPLGGHFSGLKSARGLDDIGMVLLEPRLSIPHRPLSEFLGESGRSANGFVHEVFSWLKNLGVALERVPITSRFQSSEFPDILISDNLEVINHLNCNDVETRRCLQFGVTNLALHPKFKETNELSRLPIDDALPKIYGNNYADFLLGVVQKIAGQLGLKLTARHHRALWMPLYYPETLYQAISSGRSTLSSLEFLKPKYAGVSSIVSYLRQELQASNLYSQLVDEWSSIADLNAILLHPSIASSRQVKIFCDESLFYSVPAKVPTASIGVAIGTSSTDVQPRVIHSLDRSSGWFRVSLGLSSDRSCAIELGFVEPSEPKEVTLNRVACALRENGLSLVGAPEIIYSKLRIPTAEYEVSRSEYLRSHLQSSLELSSRTNKLRWYLAKDDSRNFNSEVLHGLKAAYQSADTD